MELVHARCAGLDVHARMISACIRVVSGQGVKREVRSFGTSTVELQRMADWLASEGCTHVAMESTGVYWKPAWHVLEGHFELVLANAMQVRNMPGRKSDVNDATWLAELLAHGLIRPSFVPPAPIQELRDLTRTRKQLVREIARHTLRIQKTLEDANIKLKSVASDILGRSGRAVLRAMVAGESDPDRLAELTKGRLRASREAIIEALRGSVTEHHRFMIKLHLEQIEQLEAAVREVEARAGQAPFRAAIELLTTIPGVSETTATVIVAEIGDDMTRFPSAGHLLSWAGLCPRLDESAGKRHSNRLRQGAPWLKTVLVQAAWGASRKRDSYLRARFLRLKLRRGPKKAVVAIAASMLVATYHMLKSGVVYEDLGGDYFDRLNHQKATDRLVRQLTALGYRVQLEPAA
jgi:transposase